MCFFSSSYPLHLFTVCREHNLVSNVKTATRSLFPEVTYIFHCLPWKVVISSQWISSSREPSLSASHSLVCQMESKMSFLGGDWQRDFNQGVWIQRNRDPFLSVPIHTHTHTHARTHARTRTYIHTRTNSGMQESRLRILAWLSH